jgi:hypothetical protein
MRKILMLCLAALITLSSAHSLFAQEDKPGEAASPAKSAAPAQESHFYHLEFVVKEIGPDGKVVNSRSYTTMCASNRSGRSGSIRTGSRMPIYTGDRSQIQYIDLGINLDIQHVTPIGSDLAMDINVEVSGAAESQATDTHPTPIIRQNRWESAVLLSLGRPTIIFSSDDLSSKGKVQVELTVTPIK